MHLWKLFLSLVVAAVLATGCFSGDDSDDDEGATSSTLSGSVSRSDSDDDDDGDDAPTPGAEAPMAMGGADEEVTVRVRSFSDHGQEIDRTTSLVSEVGGREVFSVRVDLLAEGGYVIVDVDGPEVTGYSRRLHYDEPGDLDLRGEIRSLLTDHVLPPNELISGPAETLRVDLEPVSFPDPDSAVTGRFSLFDSGSADDAAMYPGDYEDVGGNSLAVVAFDYASLSQGGVSLGDILADGARGPDFSRRVPASGCSVMAALGDGGPDASFQVPVHSYDKDAGAWTDMGYAELQDEDGNAVGFGLNECRDGDYRLVYEAPPEGLDQPWWSLSYALEDPTPMCGRVRIEDDEGRGHGGIALWLGAYEGERNFRETFGATRSDGSATLNTVAFEGARGVTGSLRFWDYEAREYRSEPIDLVEREEDGSCPADVETFTMNRPDMCRVEGRVMEEGGDAPRPDTTVWIWEVGMGAEHWNTATTDGDGEYAMSAVCEAPYELSIGAVPLLAEPINFQVDGSATGDEDSDDGETVRMRDLEFVPLGPILGAAPKTEPVQLGDTAEIEVLALSFDGFYPVSYSFEYDEGTCQVDCAGEVSQSQAEDGEMPVHTWDFSGFTPDEACEVVSGQISGEDAEGNQAEAPIAILIEAEPGACEAG